MGLAARGGCQHFGSGRVKNVVMANFRHGSHVAQSDAGRAYHANGGTRGVLQFMQQLFRT